MLAARHNDDDDDDDGAEILLGYAYIYIYMYIYITSKVYEIMLIFDILSFFYHLYKL